MEKKTPHQHWLHDFKVTFLQIRFQTFSHILILFLQSVLKVFWQVVKLHSGATEGRDQRMNCNKAIHISETSVRVTWKMVKQSKLAFIKVNRSSEFFDLNIESVQLLVYLQATGQDGLWSEFVWVGYS